MCRKFNRHVGLIVYLLITDVYNFRKTQGRIEEIGRAPTILGNRR